MALGTGVLGRDAYTRENHVYKVSLSSTSVTEKLRKGLEPWMLKRV